MFNTIRKRYEQWRFDDAHDLCYRLHEIRRGSISITVYAASGEPVGMTGRDVRWYDYVWFFVLDHTRLVRFVYESTKHAALNLVCKYKGHDWVDESYGGPDTGCMAGHCKRCGYGFHHTLY